MRRPDTAGKIAALNAFKDREMLRVDMRHILNLQEKFVEFSRELTDVAEAVVTANLRLCEQILQAAHGAPQWQPDGKVAPSRLALCALGKFGGYELGYASDIELMFVYEADGKTSGPSVDHERRVLPEGRRPVPHAHPREAKRDL